MAIAKLNEKVLFSMIFNQLGFYKLNKGVKPKDVPHWFMPNEPYFRFDEEYFDTQWRVCKERGLANYLIEKGVTASKLLNWVRQYMDNNQITEIQVEVCK